MLTSGPIIESKGMLAFFWKRAKYLKIWAKLYKISKYFVKRQPHVCDYHMHETARICPEHIFILIERVLSDHRVRIIASHFPNPEVNSYYCDRNVSHNMKNVKQFFVLK